MTTHFPITTPPSPLPPLAVNPKAAAAMLGVSRSTVYALMRAGELPVVTIGARKLIPYAGLMAWFDAKRQEQQHP